MIRAAALIGKAIGSRLVGDEDDLHLVAVELYGLLAGQFRELAGDGVEDEPIARGREIELRRQRCLLFVEQQVGMEAALDDVPHAQRGRIGAIGGSRGCARHIAIALRRNA